MALSGVIDLIEVYDKDTYVPIELKTGKAPVDGVWDNHRIQLAVYTMLLEDCGKKVPAGYVRYKGVEQRPVVVNSLFKQDIKAVITQVARLLESQQIPDILDAKSKCAACSLREVCYDPAEISRLVEAARKRQSLLY